MSPTLRAIAKVVQSLSCTWVIGVIASLLVLLLLFGSNTVERTILINEEVAILLTHIIILLHRDPDTTSSPVLLFFLLSASNLGTYETVWRFVQILCKLSAIGINYFLTAACVFFALEALQAFAVATYVVLSGGFLTKFQNMAIGWGM